MTVSAARRRRRSRRSLRRGALAGALTVALAVLVGVAIERAVPRAFDCRADPATQSVAGYGGDELENARTIIAVAAERGLGERAQVLGVQAAMGESGLRNLDYGDWESSGVRNPDGSPTSSIGLFQQQDWWGSTQERMDPATAAGAFYARLVTIPGWWQLDASEAIHRVQVNADPDHYERWSSRAQEVVAALTAPCA